MADAEQKMVNDLKMMSARIGVLEQEMARMKEALSAKNIESKVMQ